MGRAAVRRTTIAAAALVLGYAGGYVLTRRALPAGGAGFVEFALTFALVGMGSTSCRRWSA